MLHQSVVITIFENVNSTVLFSHDSDNIDKGLFFLNYKQLGLPVIMRDRSEVKLSIFNHPPEFDCDSFFSI